MLQLDDPFPRWFVGNLSRPAEDQLLDVKTGDIIPVDLNSFLCRNADILAGLFQRSCKELFIDFFKDGEH